MINLPIEGRAAGRSPLRLVISAATLAALSTACATGQQPPDRSTGRSDRAISGYTEKSGATRQLEISSDDATKRANLTYSANAAWSQLPAVLQDIELPIGGLDHNERIAFHNGARAGRIGGKRLSRYLDCGIGMTAQPYADIYDVVFSYEIQVKADPEGTSTVEMRLEATAKPREVSGSPLRCTSKGSLEALVFQRLQLGAVG